MSTTEKARPTRRAALLGERPGAYAIARHVRMSPTKVRRVIDLVRGMDVSDALAVLEFAPQAASEPVYKVLASAVANAESVDNLSLNDLVVSQAFVDEGVTMRRIRARAKGSASRILKRGSHITVVVEPRAEQPTTSAPAKRAEKKSTAKPATTDATEQSADETEKEA